MARGPPSPATCGRASSGSALALAAESPGAQDTWVSLELALECLTAASRALPVEFCSLPAPSTSEKRQGTAELWPFDPSHVKHFCVTCRALAPPISL